MLRIPETDFIERLLANSPSMGEKRAKLFYTSLWKKLIDARTKERKEKTKKKVVHIDYETGADPKAVPCREMITEDGSLMEQFHARRLARERQHEYELLMNPNFKKREADKENYLGKKK
jgi:hypothetical protein